MNHYPHHIGDFNNATRHLTRVERSLYRDMLELYYDTETPLNSDPVKIGRRVLAVSEEEKSALNLVLEEFFVLQEDGWHNTRCDAEIAKYQGQIEQASRAGKASAAKRYGKNLTPVEQPLNQPEPEPEPEPRHSEAKASGGKPPMSPDEIIFGYGVPLLTSAGSSDKHARSFLGGLRKAHGDDSVVNTLRECIRAKPLQPMEWLAAAMLPDAVGATETRHQKAQREKMMRDFPNLFPQTHGVNHGAAALLG